MSDTFNGIYTIPPAVYNPDMSLDYDGIKRCVRFCLDCGCHGIVVPVYATEYFILTDDERKKVLEATIKEVDKKVPVVAGISSAYVGNAVDLARHAQAAGADSVLAAPPHVMKVALPDVFDYFRQINDAVKIPIFIQNFFPPLGAPMTTAFMMNMVKELENVSYIKEESPNSNMMITELNAYAKEHPEVELKGIMGGKGARALMEEYDRGMCGTMPPSQFTDLVVDIWDLLVKGKRQEAYELHTKCLPAFVFGGTYSVGSYRYILQRRGIVKFPGGRPAGWPKMDEYSFRDLDLIMENVKPLLRVKY